MGRLVRVRVVTDSKREEIVEGEPLIVNVKEPRERGLANKACIRLLSKHFSARIKIVTGGKSPNKTIEIC